ncbi:hypothetical protein [Cytobacillus sp. IB215316]|uniref:hypothetical protein n=1 Tax=Cytobacillus sp. IB215316 TaxID=3097354 RepID=UPI002A10CC31|nr:hypothetical protein [Cytobacillus sp. IB215316]MDX8363425.1 hypothetical protein [Cytobacillus sp. IB215316]
MRLIKSLSILTMLSTILLSGCNSVGESTNGVSVKEETVLVNDNASVVKSMADFDLYDDITEVEEYADLIIKGKYTGERDQKDFFKGGHLVQTTIESEIEIKKVYKGDKNKKDIITVFEPAYFKNDQFVSIEGYNLVNEKGNYVLLLRESSTSHGYVIVGMFQGKYDLSKQEEAKKQNKVEKYEDIKDLEYFGDEYGRFNKLKKDVKEKYK